MNKLEKLLLTFLVGASLSSCPETNNSPANTLKQTLPSTPTPSQVEQEYNYTTTIETVESEYIKSSEGGILEVITTNNLINGTKLTIPSQALSSDTLISINQVNNPPMLPNGLNYIGTPIDLEPEGISFNCPLTIQIPYSDFLLRDAGISDDSNLKLYSYSNSSNDWAEIGVSSIDTVNNLITAELNHFSYYSITCLSTTPPEDLGDPQPGDLVFATGAYWEPSNDALKYNWLPGHVGIYVGDKKEWVNGKWEPYNVIEAQGDHKTLIGFVKRDTIEPLSEFSDGGGYMGAREPKYIRLTQQQREDIVEYVEAQVGKPYAFFQTFGALFGLARGSLVKGPDSFNCVGLAEAAYEYAGVNNGEGLINWLDEDWPPIEFGISAAVLTPAEYYNQTKPAVGHKYKLPIVSFIGRGTSEHNSQIAVMNEDGSDIQEITFGVSEKNYPRLSYDRNKIIFESYNKGSSNSTLCIMNLDGSRLESLVGSNGYIQPALSSKNKLASVKQWGVVEIYLSDIDFSNCGKLMSIQKTGYTPCFSPDGDEIVCVSNTGDLLKVDIVSKNLTTLISANNSTKNAEPEFSPDGNKIVFTYRTYEREFSSGGSYQDYLVNADIYLYNNNSTKVQQLTFNTAKEFSPHFSKDGSRIFFVSELDGECQIYSMSIDGSKQRQLTYGPRNHDFGFD